MSKTLQILLLFCFSTIRLSAADNYPAGARSIALSNAFVSVSDPWSTFHNQATLANLTNLSAGVFYESKYLIDELSLAAGTIVFPTSNNTFSFSFYQFGKGTFKESKVGLAYSKRLSEKFNAAVQFDYFYYRFPENEKGHGFPTFEAGITYQAATQLTLGLHVFNPVKNGLKTHFGKEKMPIVFRLGGHYQFSDMTLIVLEIQKESDLKPLTKCGIEFLPHKKLALRFGVSGRPAQVSAGIGYSFSRITTNIAFSYHGNLGFSPSVSLNYQLKQ